MRDDDLEGWKKIKIHVLRSRNISDFHQLFLGMWNVEYMHISHFMHVFLLGCGMRVHVKYMSPGFWEVCGLRAAG